MSVDREQVRRDALIERWEQYKRACLSTEQLPHDYQTWLEGQLEQAERLVEDRTLAFLEVNRRLTEAPPQHWAVRREFNEPSYVWTGTYRKTPVEHASEVLAAYEQAQK